MADKKDKDQSPNSFEPPKPNVGDNRKAMNTIVGVLLIMSLILLWSLAQSGQSDKKNPEPPKEAPVESRRFLAGEDAGRGVAAFPKAPERGGVIEPPAVEKPQEEPTVKVVGPPPVDHEAEARRLEEQEERRKKREAQQAGLSAGLLVHKSEAANKQQESAAASGNASGGSGAPGEAVQPGGYDPAADRDKEAFFERADTKQWMSPYTREAGHLFEIKTGTVVPGIMVTGVNSDLPGNLIAQVSQNVYDTATGKHLLIPQGAKIYGAYDSRVVYGQERVLVAWNRIIFPDGSSVTLGAMPGADMAGYAGFNDKVDNHYLRIFGSAALMSLITGGMSYAMDKVDNSNNSDSNSTSMQDEMASALAAQMGQTSMKMLEKNISIKPTLGVRPGYRFNIVVTKDVIFRGPYGEIKP